MYVLCACHLSELSKGTKRLSDCKAVALEFRRVQLYQKPEAIFICSLPQLLDSFKFNFDTLIFLLIFLFWQDELFVFLTERILFR